jgi:hypothetical protein
MAKRKAGSQTASLTPDQKKLGIDPIYLFGDGVQHIVDDRYNFARDWISI